MFVYKTGYKERKNPRHSMFVQPANHPGPHMSKNDIPEDWWNPYNADGKRTAKMFEVIFVNGKAEVDSQLGEWLVKTGHAQRSPIVRASAGVLSSLASTIAGR